MLLLSVRSDKTGFYVEVQSGDKAWRSRALDPERELGFFCKEVVLGMMSTAALDKPNLQNFIPEPTELKKTVKNGIGMTDDHRKCFILKDGKEIEVVDQGPRWMVSNSLMARVGHAIKKNTVINGVF